MYLIHLILENPMADMSLDFSNFLLDYTKRFFLRTSDIVNILIACIAIAVAFFAFTISMQLQTWIILSLNGLVVFGIILIPYFILKEKLRKNNEKIFEIEDEIIHNYHYVNGKSSDEKNCILEEFRQVFTKKKDVKRLMNLLSEPCKDETPNLNTDKKN